MASKRLLATLALFVGILAICVAQESPTLLDSREDSLAIDTTLADSLNLAEEPQQRLGPLLTDVVQIGARSWLCGDSGLVAWSVNDSIWFPVGGADSTIGLNVLAFSDRLVVAGDSGRVYYKSGDSLRVAELDNSSSISALVFRGRKGLLAGENGLLAITDNGGKNWNILDPPLNVRFLSLVFHADQWFLGGTGGFLFRSADGLEWQRLPRQNYSAIVDLQSTAQGLLVLCEDGQLDRLDRANHWQSLNPAGWGEAWTLENWSSGWMIAGSAGRSLVFDSGLRTENVLDKDILYTCSLVQDNRVLLCGSRGLLAQLSLEDGSITEIQNSFAQAVDPVNSETDSTLVDEGETIELISSISADTTRYLFSAMDTWPGIADNQGKVDRLLRNYNQARFLEQPGFVVLMLDISPRGQLEQVQVLDEYPAGLGLQKYAKEVVNSLKYSPGSLDGKLVPGRLLFSLHFPVFRSNLEPWYTNDEYSPGALVDSLMEGRNRIVSQLAPKQLVKKLSFPRKAKRFHWKGEVLFRLDVVETGEILAAEVLKEDPLDYKFGTHAESVLPELKLGPQEPLPVGWLLRGYFRLNFDRKRYSKAAKQVKKGFHFVEDVFSWTVVDSSSYNPGIELLAQACDFYMGAAQPTGTADLKIVLSHDGLAVLGEISVSDSSQFNQDQQDLVQSLASMMTWGYPANLERGSKSDTLLIQLEFPLVPKAGNKLEPLFKGVKY